MTPDPSAIGSTELITLGIVAIASWLLGLVLMYVIVRMAVSHGTQTALRKHDARVARQGGYETG